MTYKDIKEIGEWLYEFIWSAVMMLVMLSIFFMGVMLV